MAGAGLAAAAGAILYVLRRNGRTVCTIHVPATTANLACGFDAFGAGFALKMTVKASVQKHATATVFEYKGEGSNEVALDESNLIWKSALVCQRKFAPGKTMPKLKVVVDNPVPFGRGLGSSATAIVAGVVLANEFMDLGLTRSELLDACLVIENHPDNLSAAIWGNGTVSVVASDGTSMTRIFKLSPAIKAVVVVPDFQVNTEKARQVLPKTYKTEDIVFNMQRCGLLPMCLGDTSPNFAMIRECMKDRLHQDQRCFLVPGLDEILALPHSPDRPQGLISTALSGAGPTILALCTGNHQNIGKQMQAILKSKNITSDVYVLPFDETGTTITWT